VVFFYKINFTKMSENKPVENQLNIEISEEIAEGT
jgi:hypothetical protein